MNTYLSSFCFTLIDRPNSESVFNPISPIIKQVKPTGKVYVITGKVTENNYSCKHNNTKLKALCVLNLKYCNKFLYPKKNWFYSLGFKNSECNAWYEKEDFCRIIMLPFEFSLVRTILGNNFIGIIDLRKRLLESEYQITLIDPE